MTFGEYMETIEIEGESVVTIGNFDGVHKGHKKLFDLTLKLSVENKLKTVVFTYANHPLEFVMNKSISKLTTNEEKDRLFRKMGMDYVLNVPFDESIMNMSTEEFIRAILIDSLRAKHLVLGEDARFGKGREGSAKGIKEIGERLGLQVDIVPLYFEDGIRISSTSIRELIVQGELQQAAIYLGRPYCIRGTVVHGKKNGRKMGFPTANIKYDPEVVLPHIGVYYTTVEYNGECYVGATSVGYNPTIAGMEKEVHLEVNILNFSKEIYDETISVFFHKKIRGEIKFDTMNELKEQIHRDQETIMKLFLEENLSQKEAKVFTKKEVCDIII